MEIRTLRGKIACKLMIIFLICTSCSAQKDSHSGEEIIYSLIEHHFKIIGREDFPQFLYYKTLPIKANSRFQFIIENELSGFLNDSIFKKNCNKIQTIFNSDQIEKMNLVFSNLESVILDEKKLSKPILNKLFLQNETYNEAPAKANRKISYPILIKGNESTYAIFIEDAHNEGGNLYLYELKDNSWNLICKDSMWLV